MLPKLVMRSSRVTFRADSNQEDGPYVLIQRGFLEEDEGELAPCYIETLDECLIGHYSVLDAVLTRNRFILRLPPPTNETLEVEVQASDHKFKDIRRVLRIILQEDIYKDG